MSMDSSARMETVTELAMKAKMDRTVIPELWSMVEGLIQAICRRYCRIDSGVRHYELDDLCQSSYFGFLKAIKAFDPERGAFSTCLNYYIRRSCTLEVRKYQGKAAPIYSAQSLSKPLGNTDGLTIDDTLSDPHTPEHFEAVEIGVMVGIILDETDKIPNIRHRRVIRECTYQGRTLQSFADEFGISREAARVIEKYAIATLRRRPVIRDMRREYFAEIRAAADDSATSPYRRKGTASFKLDFESAVDAVILSMEKRVCSGANAGLT